MAKATLLGCSATCRGLVDTIMVSDHAPPLPVTLNVREVTEENLNGQMRIAYAILCHYFRQHLMG